MIKIFFAHNLSFLRKASNLNQRELAERLKIKQTAISNYEKNVSVPEFKTLIEIIKLFGVNAHDLIFKDLSNGVYSKAEYTKEQPVNNDNTYIIELQRKLIEKLEAELEAYKVDNKKAV